MKHVKNYFLENFDHVFLDNLVLSAHVGCTKEERATPQPIRFALTLYYPLKKSGISDDIKHTIDYAAVLANVKKLLQKKTFVLLEALTEEMTNLLFSTTPANTISIRASKHVFAEAEEAGVFIVRERTAK